MASLLILVVNTSILKVMPTKVIKPIVLFILLSILFSGVYLTVYVTVHQSLRQSANDPQIQLAEDVASKLESGKQTDLQPTIPSKNSLAPFVMIIDKDHKLVKSNAADIATLPLPPTGSFNLAKAGSEITFTWEPEHNLRFAAVIRYVKVGDKDVYVLAARSLREVEVRENRAFVTVAMAWVATESVLLFGSAAFYFFFAKTGASKATV
jgi:hypothetical protein